MSNSDDKCLDPAALARLHQLGGPKFVREMVALFLDYAPKRITEAFAAQRAGDRLGIAKAVHPLRSGGGHVGAYDLRDLAARIEQLADGGTVEDLAPLLSELETTLAQVRVQLEKEMERLSP